MPVWPLQKDCDSFYGNPRGRGGGAKSSNQWESQNLVAIHCPWQLYNDENVKQKINSFRMHRKVEESLMRILNKAWEEIWHKDQALVEKDNMHRFSGSFVYRNIRGSSRLSMHAYGCAIDFAANLMPLGSKWDEKKGPPKAFIKLFEDEGWVWGGEWTSRPDPMHFQAARTHA